MALPAAAATTAVAVSNGVRAGPPLPADLAEYEKIIRLRDDVLAGRHPKLKPQQQLLNHSAANSAAVAANNAIASAHVPATTSSFSASSLPSLPASNYNAQGRLQAHGKTVARDDALPGLDPVLLTGPPLLTAADRDLSRSVLQAHMNSEIKRRPHQWPKLDRENILPDYDVDDLLRKAHASTKPWTNEKNNRRKERVSRSGSVDGDNSYYSSQANDDDDDDEEAEAGRATKTTKPCQYFFKRGKCHKGDACKFSHDPAFEAQLKPAVPPTQPAKHRLQAATPPNKRARRDGARDSGGQINLDQASPVLVRRVDEFGRDIPPGRVVVEEQQQQHQHVRRSPPTGPSRLQGHERRPSGRMIAAHDGPVIHNQIISPIAPQPSRVSPLAVSKSAYGPSRSQQQQQQQQQHHQQQQQARVENNRISSGQGIHNGNGNHQNAAPTQPLSRKRRRDQNGDENRNTIARRRLESPPVQIKAEPSSPRLVENVPQYRYVERDDGARQPVIVESHPYGVRRLEQEGPREIHYVDEPGYRRVSSPMVRVVSRAEPRYEVRREPELRRVVSERHPLRAASPAVHAARPAYVDDPTRLPLQPSVVYLARGDNEPPNGYRASVAPQSSHQSPRVMPESGRPEFIEPRRIQSPAMQQSMAPPPVRRIVRDQYGNEFYESVPEPSRFSVAPEPRYAPEHAYAARPVSRMTSAMPEQNRQMREGTMLRRDDHEPTSPRFVEGPPAGRQASVAPYARREPEYITERPSMMRLDDAGRGGEDPYERVVYRQAAAAPPPPQLPPGTMYAEKEGAAYYEPQREVYRVQSTRPDAVRYGSMAPPAQRYEYVDERTGRYVPAGEQRRYMLE